jgi:hydrogenase assembly chaperone HypC/HupF
MCLTVPGKVLKVEGDWALVDFLGSKKKISLKYVKAKENDFIIVSGPVAAERISAERAKKMLEALREASYGNSR